MPSIDCRHIFYSWDWNSTREVISWWDKSWGGVLDTQLCSCNVDATCGTWCAVVAFVGEGSGDVFCSEVENWNLFVCLIEDPNGLKLPLESPQPTRLGNSCKDAIYVNDSTIQYRIPLFVFVWFSGCRVSRWWNRWPVKVKRLVVRNCWESRIASSWRTICFFKRKKHAVSCYHVWRFIHCKQKAVTGTLRCELVRWQTQGRKRWLLH